MNPARFTKRKMLLFLLLCLLMQHGRAQFDSTNKRHCNFYIYTKEAGAKIDFFGKTILLRARIKSALSKKALYVIVAENSQQVSNRMIEILNDRKAMIGNVWIDSHGLYRQGYSSFHIGIDEFSYKNILDTTYTKSLRDLAAYCDEQTNFGLGSCYGGATFNFPGSATALPGRMNGDSLMIGLGNIFTRSIIYGSESWVMAKPGILNDNFGFAGYPLGKRYRTTYWKPVWERLGKWNRYSKISGIFEPVNTIALNGKGQINVRMRSYQQLEKGQKAVRRNVAKLG